VPPTPSTSRTPTTVFLLPLSKQIPKIRIRTRRPHLLLNQRILANIDAWPASSRYPEGHFIRALGQLETREAETEALLIEWDVVYRGFSETVLKCLPEEGHAWKVPEVLPSGRKDFRDRLVCSIDPPGIPPNRLGDAVADEQGVRILMMRCMLGCWRMGIGKLECILRM